MINVDPYLFLEFSDLTWCFLVALMPDSKETELGISNQEASPSACRNTGIVLLPCCAWECVPIVISSGVDISEVPRCHLLQQMSYQ